MGDFASQPRLAEAWTYSAAALRAVIENLERCVYVLNSEGRFVIINDRFRRWLDRPETEMLGHTVFDVWPLPLAEREAAEHQRALDGERIEREDEFPCSDLGGTAPRLVRVSYLKVPLYDGEGVVRGVVTQFREGAGAGLS